MPNRINHNLAMNSANNNMQQTHLLTLANNKHDAIQTASELTNSKIDTLSGAINNNIGDAQVKLQTYVYGYDSPNGLARPLAVTSNGELKVSNDVLEVSAETVNLNTDTLEAKIQATNDKLDSFSGAGNNNVGEGSTKLQTYLYARDVAAGNFKPLVCDGDAHLQVDVLSSAAPTGAATETTLAAAEVHLGNIETAVQLSDDVVTAQSAAHPGKANAVGGRYYVDNTFRDIRVDDIGKVIIDSPAGSDINTRLDTLATKLNGGLPSALTASGNLKISIEEGGATGGDASAANQTTMIGHLNTIEGDTTSLDSKITACNTGAIAGTVTANAGTNLNTSALALESTASAAEVHLGNIETKQTSIDGKITACNTGAIAGTVTANAGTNLNTSALALESGGNLASIVTKQTSIDGKITACNTGAIAGTVTANAGTNLNTSALALESGGNLATISTKATSIDGKINQGYDSQIASGGSGLQQNLIYGRDISGNLDALRTDASGHLEVVVDDMVKGQAAMASSFPVVIASDQSVVSIKDLRDYNTIVTLSAALSVPNSGNNDSSIVSSNKLTDTYIVQVQCDDITYTDFNAEIFESMDASNYKSTFQISQGMTPAFFIFERIEKIAPNWKVRVNNTGASTKNFTIKYIKAD